MPPQQPQNPQDPNQPQPIQFQPVVPQQAPYVGQPASQYIQPPSAPVLQIIGLILAFLLSPIGLIISIIGSGKARREGNNTGKTLSLIGIIVGIIGTLLLLGIAILTLTASNGIQQQEEQAQTQTDGAGSQTDLYSIKNGLETYYSEGPDATYPTLSQLNDSSWRSQNNVSFSYTDTFVSGTPSDGQVSYVPLPSSCAGTESSPCTSYTISASINGTVKTLQSSVSGN